MAGDAYLSGTWSRLRNGARLRIALYSPALPDSGASNGVVTYTRILRDAFRELGHSVLVVTPNHIEDFYGKVSDLPPLGRITSPGRLLLNLPYSYGGSTPWAWLRVLSAFKAARRAGADIFEIEESFGWAGRLAGRGIPIVERLHGPHVYGRDQVETAEERRVGDIREQAEVASFAKVQALTCPSERLLAAMEGRCKFRLPIAYVIPNPMPAADEKSKWHVERANPDSILCVGRFDLRKGSDIVIHAFARALERRPTLTLSLVGPDSGLRSPNGNLVHFEEFIRAEVAPEVRSRIRFLGPQPSERISSLRLKSGFSVVGSRFENFPYSIAEAMAVGMPVVASDSFGNAEMVRQCVDGRVVPVGDTEAMSRAMVEMADSPDILERMGRSAYLRVAEWLSPESIARKTIEVYREAIARHRASGRRGN